MKVIGLAVLIFTSGCADTASHSVVNSGEENSRAAAERRGEVPLWTSDDSAFVTDVKSISYEYELRDGKRLNVRLIQETAPWTCLISFDGKVYQTQVPTVGQFPRFLGFHVRDYRRLGPGFENFEIFVRYTDRSSSREEDDVVLHVRPDGVEVVRN
ncbi:MAG TPA: hypothetical protein PK752_03570 [Accumulibacter sp.]|uniref:hypothetical protein n=1 Tax=Accumulibacter sp. TaxID=2053492 RepID=UPI002CCF0847|nr:hypothetical protein [Accumulibacter sp.]HRD87327.1 hypothetical protein [Accumulibacter sp.]